LRGFDAKVLSLCARWLTVREIRGHLAELYSVVLFDALRVRVRDEGVVRNKAASLALRNATATWWKGSVDWTRPISHLALLFSDRFVGNV
jgi:transposase-like protein